MTKVVVTGIGAVCSHGMNIAEIWDSIIHDGNRIAPINSDTHFDSSKYKQTRDKVVAAVGRTDDQLREHIDPENRKLKRLDRHQLFALIAAKNAHDSNLVTLVGVDKTRFGVSLGTGDGGLKTGFQSDMLLFEDKPLGPFANLGQLPNIFAGYVANAYGLKGPSTVHCTACAASAHAIRDGADQILLGRADLMLVGGAEAAITPFGIASFAGQKAMGSDSKPYQASRNGFIMGEGSAMLLLENEDHAKARGASIHAELAGYGATTDGNEENDITAPDLDGGYRSAMLALKMAKLAPVDISYINTHGTGTMADPIELSGIKHWGEGFGTRIPLSSTKSYHGHLLGAAGALESVLSIMMIKNDTLIPTRGLTRENMDVSCAEFNHVLAAPVQSKINHVLSNSFGFGGTNATLIFSRYN